MEPSEELITLMATLEMYLSDLDTQLTDIQEKRVATVKSLETLKNLTLQNMPL